MSWFEENKKVLLFGAELEAAGEKENAQKVYISYVKDAAKISEYDDELEILYGRLVYEHGISGYAEAVDYATIALCAKSLLVLARSKFPSGDAWENVPKDGVQNAKLIDFFCWLSERRQVDIKHYEILKQAKRVMEENSKLLVATTSAVSRSGLMEVIRDIVSGNIKASNKGLR